MIVAVVCFKEYYLIKQIISNQMPTCFVIVWCNHYA